MNEDQKLNFFENTIHNLDISTPPPLNWCSLLAPQQCTQICVTKLASTWPVTLRVSIKI